MIVTSHGFTCGYQDQEMYDTMKEQWWILMGKYKAESSAAESFHFPIKISFFLHFLELLLLMYIYIYIYIQILSFTVKYPFPWDKLCNIITALICEIQ